MFIFYKTYLLLFIGRDERMYGKPKLEPGIRNQSRNPDFGFRITAFPYAKSSRGGGGEGLCMPSPSTSPLDPPLVTYGIHERVVCPKKHTCELIGNKAFAKYR